MQKRAIKKVLVIGRGEMHDGKSKTLDCDEIQSCIAILEEECQAVLLTNAGTEPMMDAVLDIPIYQLPLNSSFINEIVQKEKPDAVFAPFLGSRGRKLVKRLAREGYWQKQSIYVIDDNYIKDNSLSANRAIRKAIAAASLRQCRQVEVSSVDEATGIPGTIGDFPVAIRSTEKGFSIVDTPHAFHSKLSLHLTESAQHKVLIEEYLSGWKEVTVGVLKDVQNEIVVTHTSERVVPMGIHSANSVSVSPIKTLHKSKIELVTGAALHLAKFLDDFVGYCAVKFGIEPDTGKPLVTGVDFSTDGSAHVSLTSGYPLVKLATKLLMGSCLSDLKISSPAFPNRESAERILLTVPEYELREDGGAGKLHSSAKAVTHKIYVGQNFCEVFRKAWTAESHYSFSKNGKTTNLSILQERLLKPSWHQMHWIYQTFMAGSSVREIEKVTGIDPWFLQQIELIFKAEQQLANQSLSSISKEQWATLKLCGFSDNQIAEILNQYADEEELISESAVRNQREFFNINPSTICFGCLQGDFFKPNKKIMVLTASGKDKGSSSLKIPAFVLAKEARQMGFDVVLVGSNSSAIPFWMMFADHLYIENLNWEVVYEIYKKEDPSGIFIEADKGMAALEKRFAKAGAPIVKVPFELTNRMRNSA